LTHTLASTRAKKKSPAIKTHMALILKGESRYSIPPQTFISKVGESQSITELGNICLEDSYVTYLLEVRRVQSIKALVWATIFLSNTTFRPVMGVSETPN
jgi:hypothetical protein